MFQLYPEHKKIVLPYRADVEAILQSPAAQRFETGGAWYLAIDHKIQSVRLLRNLGLNAPSPGLTDYDWNGGSPFESQKATFDLCTVARRAYVLSEMGVGKTRAVLWAYDYLRREGMLNKLLVVAPLSTLTTVWENEIFENFPHLRTVVLYGDRKKRSKLLATDADVYVINHEGVEVLHAELWGRPDINGIIVDELASYRNSKSKRWKSLEPLVKRSEYSWGLTGTPTPNAATDAFGQARLLTPESAGFSFKAYRDKVQRQVGTFKWVDRPEATSIVHDTLQPAVRFTREQCFDLPPTTYTTLEVGLDTAAIRVYKEMLNELASEVKGREIIASNEGVKLSKLLQISAGFAYDSQGKPIYIGGLDRFKQCVEVIEAIPNQKVIVFANFTYMVELLAGVLGQKYNVGKIHGGVPKAERDAVFQSFQKGGPCRIIVAHPKTMSHGLTLTAAETIIWATPTTSNETHDQANARITRSGQTKNTQIVYLTATAAETKVYQRLKKKGAMQGTLLELFEEQ
jgi:SNF2 family DNA or RNA helicase